MNPPTIGTITYMKIYSKASIINPPNIYNTQVLLLLCLQGTWFPRCREYKLSNNYPNIDGEENLTPVEETVEEVVEEEVIEESVEEDAAEEILEAGEVEAAPTPTITMNVKIP